MTVRSTRDKLNRMFPGSNKKPPGSQSESHGPSGSTGTSSSSEALRRVEQELLGSELAIETESLSVKQRLERLLTATRSRPRSESAAPPDSYDSNRVSLEEALPGEEVENELGRHYRLDRSYPLDHHHGTIRLERLKDIPKESFSVLARGRDDATVELSNTLFLDTETTGLAGGSGTCAFLVGLGFLEDDRFVVRQLFMRNYGEEASMLLALSETLSRFESLVSYNGKSYDMPLLESRFVLSRQRVDFEGRPHFDLLHPARSLWRARFESCRLTELESVLLGLGRTGDIPGHMIPEVYFRFLRSANAARVVQVFNHNRYDILSLAALTVAASDMLDEERIPDDPRDDYSLGKLFERENEPDRAIRHYHRAVVAGIQGPVRRRTLLQLAGQLKRRGEWDRALPHWEELTQEHGSESIQALHELAMFHEHRGRAFSSALKLCQTAIEKLDQDPALSYEFRLRWRNAFVHRRLRLERRLAEDRNQRKPGMPLPSLDVNDG